MYFRSILSGTLAVLLLSGSASFARDVSDRTNPVSSSHAVPMPEHDLPGVFRTRDTEPVRMAQATSDPRVVALEEQIRTLSGKIEELNFQILQMQEQMRKQQEDNEFRFQELEKRGDAGGRKTDPKVAGDPAATTGEKPAVEAGAKADATKPPSSIEEVIVDNGTGEPAGAGTPEKTFGTITFDQNGNVVGGGVGDKTTADKGAADGSSDKTVVAALPATDDPEELYRNSYQFILSGDYSTAETGFRDHIARFPSDTKTADAHFWLGESLLGQQKYRDAAEVFLAANKDYPKSKKAPEMLLKLGISLVGLNQRDVACATFGEVTKRYPDISTALKGRVKQEQALAAC